MLKRLLTIVACLVVAAVALGVFAVIAVLVINWSDRPPSAQAIEFKRYHDQQYSLDVNNNGYAYLLAFDVPEDDDPQQRGERRILWTHEMSGALAANKTYEFPGQEYDDTAKSSAGIAILKEFCQRYNPDCVPQIRENLSEVRQSLAESSWIIERYSELIAHETWVENAYVHLSLPLPAYHHVMTAQKIYLVNTFLNMDQLQPSDIRQALEADLTFWRNVQKDSGILITKMIAVAAIHHNFYWTNQILRHLPADKIAEVLPPAVLTPMSQDELSMYRCFVGEWIFAKNSFSSMEDIMKNADEIDGQEHAQNSLIRLMQKKSFHPQDTMNRLARRYGAVIAHFNRPLEYYPDALSSFEELHSQETMASYLRDPYNITGRILIDISMPAYADYVVRVGDIEGSRRALALISRMRHEQIPPFEAGAFMARASEKNPYTNAAFEWDATENALIFTGLQGGERARHVYHY